MVVKVNETLYDKRGRITAVKYVDSTASPRVNGKLLLRANYFYYSNYRQTMFTRTGTSPSAYDIGQWGTGPQQYVKERAAAAAVARARLVGRIHKGDSALGVTLGSARQSRDMVAQRMKQSYQLLQRASSIERKREFKRDLRSLTDLPLKELGKQIGSHHLEWIFGWVPLIQDVHNAMGVLTGDLPGHFLSSRGRTFTDKESATDVGGLNYSVVLLQHTAVWSCKVRVSNPNLWLANRLGLINPAVVIWDLVPWSFVVNMFVNVNSVLNSFTDLAGLELSNSSVTYTTRGVRTQIYRPSPYYTGSSSCTHVVRQTERILGQPPKPSLEFRCPELNLETAAMFASLALQRVNKITSVLSKISKH